MNQDVLKVLDEIERLSPDPFDPELDVTINTLLESGLFDSYHIASRRLKAALKSGKLERRWGFGPDGRACYIYRTVRDNKSKSQTKGE